MGRDDALLWSRRMVVDGNVRYGDVLIGGERDLLSDDLDANKVLELTKDRQC